MHALETGMSMGVKWGNNVYERGLKDAVQILDVPLPKSSILEQEAKLRHPAGSQVFAFYLHSEARVECIPISLPNCHAPSGTWACVSSPFSTNDSKTNNHSDCSQLKAGFFLCTPRALVWGQWEGLAGYSVPLLSSFYFHPIPSAVLEIAGGDEKGLGRSYLTDSCNGLGVPEWPGCYSAGADSCREGSPGTLALTVPPLQCPWFGCGFCSWTFVTLSSAPVLLLDHLSLLGDPFKDNSLFSAMGL